MRSDSPVKALISGACGRDLWVRCPSALRIAGNHTIKGGFRKSHCRGCPKINNIRVGLFWLDASRKRAYNIVTSGMNRDPSRSEGSTVFSVGADGDHAFPSDIRPEVAPRMNVAFATAWFAFTTDHQEAKPPDPGCSTDSGTAVARDSTRLRRGL